MFNILAFSLLWKWANMRYLIISVCMLVACTSASAQCFDARGIPVAEIPNYQLNDIAQANLMPNGAPVIFFNPNVIVNFSFPTRLFFTFHECAHHVLGHALGRLVMNMEQEADCWAIRTIVSRQMISDQQLQMIQSELYTFGPGDWTHLPGPQRAINLQACLQ